MDDGILRMHLTRFKFLFLPLVCSVLLLAGADSLYALTETTIASTLNRPRGLAIEEVNDHLYFVEYDAGTPKRIELLPPPPPYTIVTISTGFNHPEDVELDLDHGYAYVTERHGAPHKSSGIGIFIHLDGGFYWCLY